MDSSNEKHQEERQQCVCVSVCKKYLTQEDFSPLKRCVMRLREPQKHINQKSMPISAEPRAALIFCFSVICASAELAESSLVVQKEVMNIDLPPWTLQQQVSFSFSVLPGVTTQTWHNRPAVISGYDTGHLRHALSLFLFNIDRLFPADEIPGLNISSFLTVSTNVLWSALSTNLQWSQQPTSTKCLKAVFDTAGLSILLIINGSLTNGQFPNFQFFEGFRDSGWVSQ